MSDPGTDMWQQAVAQQSGAPAAPWLQSLRSNAAARFAALNWPTTRHEAWKYTNLTSLVQTPFVLAPKAPSPVASVAPAWAGAHRAVFINGHFAANLSQLPQQAGVTVQPLSEALQDPNAAVQQHVGQLHLADTQTFAALGQALLQDGLFIHIGKGVSLQAPLELLFVSSSTGSAWMTHPHVVVVAEADSHSCLIERHESLTGATDTGNTSDTCLTNVVTEVQLQRGAHVQHYALQAQGPGSFHMNTLAAHVAQDAEFTAFNLCTGGALARQNTQVQLQGTRARCLLSGLQLGRGQQHQDVQVVVDHANTHTQSRQLFKGVFDDSAMGIFSGKVMVHPGAVKTDAQQLNRNLLLSRQAMAHTLPQLEILTDDVKCSHGATVGQLDDDARFYLRSRGLDAETTQQLLTFAFASDVLTSIPHAGVRQAFDAKVRAWLRMPAESTGVL